MTQNRTLFYEGNVSALFVLHQITPFVRQYAILSDKWGEVHFGSVGL